MDKRGVIYDCYLEEFVEFNSGASHGYYACNLCDINGKFHTELVHRLVANTWLGDTKGKEVHHKNKNRLDPRAKNLKIIDIHEHAIMHNRGSNNNTAKLNEKDVETICKLLLSGNMTHREIAQCMSRQKRDYITVDSIDKIANGSNWKHITKKYKLKKQKRETMNEFSDKAVDIARMIVVKKLSYKEVAAQLGVDTKSKAYTRLLGCIPRYVDNFNNGVYGLFRK